MKYKKIALLPLFALSFSASAGMPVGNFLLKTKDGLMCFNSSYNSEFNQTVLTDGDSFFIVTQVLA